jgi:hypothetical protein
VANLIAKNPAWIEIHEKMNTVGFSQFIIALIVAFAEGMNVAHDHAQLGSAVGIMVLANLATGFVIRYLARYLNSIRPIYTKVSRIFHIVLGFLILAVGHYTCISGIEVLFGEGFNYRMFVGLYGGWLCFLMMLISYAEFRMHLQIMDPKKASRRKKKKKSSSNSRNLPIFSWKQINERVEAGSLWMVINDEIYVSCIGSLKFNWFSIFIFF